VRGLKFYKSHIDDTVSRSRTLTGAWIEILQAKKVIAAKKRRTLTGAWIEIVYHRLYVPALVSRTLTGAWIEMNRLNEVKPQESVAPSRVRGLKL